MYKVSPQKFTARLARIQNSETIGFYPRLFIKRFVISNNEFNDNKRFIINKKGKNGGWDL